MIEIRKDNEGKTEAILSNSEGHPMKAKPPRASARWRAVMGKRAGWREIAHQLASTRKIPEGLITYSARSEVYFTSRQPEASAVSAVWPL